ncbi:hypothetical protein [Nitrosospira multiformis]|nr:hypothetical protein [Nitrosospira multiformis]
MPRANLERLRSAERYPKIYFANADGLTVNMLHSKLRDILASAKE